MTVFWRCFACSIVASLTAVLVPAAQVDQENWPEAIPGVAVFPGAQQAFTPTLDRMDSVQLYMGNRTAVGWPGGASAINLRQGGIDGPIIAASQPTIAAPWHEGPIGYGFSPAVPLVPGQVYVLEPVSLTQYLMPWYSTESSYPGKFYFQGNASDGRDLMFRVGLGLDVVPEPSTMLLFLMSVGVLFWFGHSLGMASISLGVAQSATQGSPDRRERES